MVEFGTDLLGRKEEKRDAGISITVRTFGKEGIFFVSGNITATTVKELDEKLKTQFQDILKLAKLIFDLPKMEDK